MAGLSKLARALSKMFFETQGKMERRRVTDMVGDLRQCLVRIGEKVPRLDDSLGFKILPGREAQLLAKKRGKP